MKPNQNLQIAAAKAEEKKKEPLPAPVPKPAPPVQVRPPESAMGRPDPAEQRRRENANKYVNQHANPYKKDKYGLSPGMAAAMGVGGTPAHRAHTP